MNAKYKAYLQQQLKAAIEEFEQAKASAIYDLQHIDPYHAQDWGAGYYSKIEKITASGTKVQQWEKALAEYTKCEENRK